MKNVKVMFLGVFFSLSAVASEALPVELERLIPVGAESVRLEGVTPDGQPCVSTISNSTLAFEVLNFIPTEDSTIDPKNLARFQVGLGYELISEEERENGIVVYESVQNAEEIFSSDKKSVLFLEKDEEGILASLDVISKESFFGFFKTKARIRCEF